MTSYQGSLNLEQIGSLYKDYLLGMANGSVWYNFGTYVQRNTIINCAVDGRMLNTMPDVEVLAELQHNYNNQIGTQNIADGFTAETPVSYWSDEPEYGAYEADGTPTIPFMYIMIMLVLIFLLVVAFVHV